MMTIPKDQAFTEFVARLRRAGASDSSIASALNGSEWANVDGRRWHGRQVARICASPTGPHRPVGLAAAVSDDASVAEQHAGDHDGDVCDDPACHVHQRRALLQALWGFHPFDARAQHMINASVGSGDSAETVASRLNRAGITPPTGQRWSARLVRLALHFSLPSTQPSTGPDVPADHFPVAA
jgi:hypothetical protein